MKNCLACEKPIEPFMSFGRMPIANGFLTEDRFKDEYYFELAVSFCPGCAMVQLAEQPERERMFHENYAFFSSTSVRMARHFEEFALFVRRTFLPATDPLVVEIGSNDGIMLKHFAGAGIRHIGVEPSANVAEAARANGVETLCSFFDAALARRIRDDSGPADAILAANVMCHIPYLHSIMDGVTTLLKQSGVLIFEDPYLGDIIEKTSYDQIYDEHAFYFSATSLDRLFAVHGLELIDVAPQNVHGGSMRYVVGRRGAHPVSSGVNTLKKQESDMGLSDPRTFETFRASTERSRDSLIARLDKLRAQGKRVVGYGATSKSTTVTNYCGITPGHVQFISDTTPTKHNKYSPGAHIPVRPYEEFCREYPDVALLFAWNHAGEIMEKENAFRKSGGKWLVYVPEVEIF